jgi:uncharacterized protein YdeI (YjbR/CyaY-like superfamily)
VKASPRRPTEAAGRAEPIYFADPAKLRVWLMRNHRTASEAWVGLHRKATGTPSVTWPELVDQVLCFGWIDGIRKRIDGERYMIRITPRKSGSHWSLVNLRRAPQLIELGLMEGAGREAYEARDEAKARRYSYEREQAALSPEYEKALRASEAAWTFFDAQPPSYRKAAVAWVVTAKREETRRRRLATLIRDSENGLRIGPLRR